MAGRLPFGEGGVRCSVADEEDGDGGQADVDDQVLIVARLSADLDEIEMREGIFWQKGGITLT